MVFLIIIMLDDGHFGIWLDIENKIKNAKWDNYNAIESQKIKIGLKWFFHLYTKVFFFLYYQVSLGQLKVYALCVWHMPTYWRCPRPHTASLGLKIPFCHCHCHWKCHNILIFLGRCMSMLGCLSSVYLCFPSFLFLSIKWQLDSICC